MSKRDFYFETEGVCIISTRVPKFALKLPFGSVNGRHYQPMSNQSMNRAIILCRWERYENLPLWYMHQAFEKDEDTCLDKIGLCTHIMIIEWYQTHPTSTFSYVIFVELH